MELVLCIDIFTNSKPTIYNNSKWHSFVLNFEQQVEAKMKTNRTLYNNSVKLLNLDVIKNSLAKNVYGEQNMKLTDWHALP